MTDTVKIINDLISICKQIDESDQKGKIFSLNIPISKGYEYEVHFLPKKIVGRESE